METNPSAKRVKLAHAGLHIYFICDLYPKHFVGHDKCSENFWNRSENNNRPTVKDSSVVRYFEHHNPHKIQIQIQIQNFLLIPGGKLFKLVVCCFRVKVHQK